MSKQKLKFKISGKNVVYEGRPETRIKDLIEILVKMGVNENIVIPTFRENIKDEKMYTDEQIKEYFTTAVQARLKKKGTASSTAQPKKGVSDAEEAEKPQKITLHYKGKPFSYEGLPSQKQMALIHLLAKQKDVTPELAIETFRQNIKHSASYSDEEIWQMIQERLESRRAREEEANSSATEGSNSHPIITAGTQAISEIHGMTEEDQKQLHEFINNVLTRPFNVEDLLSNGPNSGGTEQSWMVSSLPSRMPGKVTVYCQESDSSMKKIVQVDRNISFEDFYNTVEKKFGYRVYLSFMEDDDVIILDDDHVLSMFLEMQSSGKKLKLIVSKNVQHTSSDVQGNQMPLSSAAASVSHTEPEYSNGEITIKNIQTFTGHTLAVYCCSFSPNGDEFVTCSRDRSVRLWKISDGTHSLMKGGHNGYALSCNFSPKGDLLVSSADDRSIKLWNTRTSSKFKTLTGHENKVYCVQFNSTGEYLVSASCDNSLRVWRVENFSKVVTLKGHTLSVFSCDFSNTDYGKYIVSGSDDRLVKIWDWMERKEVRTLIGHLGTIWSVKFSNNDAYIVSASMDHELKLWGTGTGVCLRTLAAHKVPIHHALFSADDKYIFSCARDCTVKVWRVDNGQHVATVTGHLNTVYHIDIQGNKMLTCSLDSTVKLWSLEYKQ